MTNKSPTSMKTMEETIQRITQGIRDAIDILEHRSHFNHEADCRGTVIQHLKYVLAGPKNGDTMPDISHLAADIDRAISDADSNERAVFAIIYILQDHQRLLEILGAMGLDVKPTTPESDAWDAGYEWMIRQRNSREV